VVVVVGCRRRIAEMSNFKFGGGDSVPPECRRAFPFDFHINMEVFFLVKYHVKL
jgi:hypothetical protein